MQSRRDQLQAYRFLTRRALAALVTGEPDLPEAPMRRLSVTTITGIMVAVLVTAGFAAFGFFRPGTSTKLTAGTIYIERDTGAQFVILSDNQLHPALNYTSAVLALAGSGQKGQVGTKTVAASALSRQPHGYTAGIEGVPQSLPRSTSQLVRSPWSVCSKLTAQQAADSNQAMVTVGVGDDQGATPLPVDDGVVVRTPHDGRLYLLWHGQRFQIDQRVANLLDLGTGQPVVVGTSLLNGLTQGHALTRPSIPDLGKPWRRIGTSQAVIGQLVHVRDDDTYRLVLADGISQVSPFATILLKSLALGGHPLVPVEANLADLASLPVSSDPTGVLDQFKGFPATKPTVPATPAQAGGVCVLYRENATPALAVPAGSAPQGGGSSESARSQQGVADKVNLPGEKAAVVAPDDNSATRFVVAAPGEKFAASSDALAALGYGSVAPVKLPSQLLLLLPTGPALDHDKAVLPAGG